VADGWCWFVLREKYCWLVAGGWFALREKHCWLVADKPSEQGVLPSLTIRGLLSLGEVLEELAEINHVPSTSVPFSPSSPEDEISANSSGSSSTSLSELEYPSGLAGGTRRAMRR
jgi:hypothetical protein